MEKTSEHRPDGGGCLFWMVIAAVIVLFIQMFLDQSTR